MNSPSFFALLVGQGPTLLVYVAAAIAAVVLRARSPVASSLVLAGSVLSVIVSVGWALLMDWAIRAGRMQTLPWWSFAGNVLHAVSIALIVAAAFAGRRKALGAGFEVQTATRYVPPDG